MKITEIVSKGFDASSLKKAAAKKAEPAAEEAPKAKKAAPKAKAASAPEVKEEAPKAEKKAPAKKAPAKKAAPKADATPDDLTQLKGVGPAIAKKLVEAGITHFAQIAAFTPEDVEAFEEKLSFKGRIERDGWIEQAKDLAK